MSSISSLSMVSEHSFPFGHETFESIARTYDRMNEGMDDMHSDLMEIKEMLIQMNANLCYLLAERELDEAEVEDNLVPHPAEIVVQDLEKWVDPLLGSKKSEPDFIGSAIPFTGNEKATDDRIECLGFNCYGSEDTISDEWSRLSSQPRISEVREDTRSRYHIKKSIKCYHKVRKKVFETSVDSDFKASSDSAKKFMGVKAVVMKRRSDLGKKATQQRLSQACRNYGMFCDFSGSRDCKGNELNRTLLVTVSQLRYAITDDVLFRVFFPYGTVEKFITVQESVGYQALVQYRTQQCATAARSALNGRDIYDGCCQLDIQFSNCFGVYKEHKINRQGKKVTNTGSKRPSVRFDYGSHSQASFCLRNHGNSVEKYGRNLYEIEENESMLSRCFDGELQKQKKMAAVQNSKAGNMITQSIKASVTVELYRGEVWLEMVWSEYKIRVSLAINKAERIREPGGLLIMSEMQEIAIKLRFQKLYEKRGEWRRILPDAFLEASLYLDWYEWDPGEVEVSRKLRKISKIVRKGQLRRIQGLTSGYNKKSGSGSQLKHLLDHCSHHDQWTGEVHIMINGLNCNRNSLATVEFCGVDLLVALADFEKRTEGWADTQALEFEDTQRQELRGMAGNTENSEVVKWVLLFSSLCDIKTDSRTSLEAEACAPYMKFVLFVEQDQNREMAWAYFETARAVYKELTICEELFTAYQDARNTMRCDLVRAGNAESVLVEEALGKSQIIANKDEGTNLNERVAIKSQGLKGLDLMITRIQHSLRQLLEYGFSHTDPYLGNLYEPPDGKLLFLDFGLMSETSEEACLTSKMLEWFLKGRVRLDSGTRIGQYEKVRDVITKLVFYKIEALIDKEQINGTFLSLGIDSITALLDIEFCVPWEFVKCREWNESCERRNEVVLISLIEQKFHESWKVGSVTVELPTLRNEARLSDVNRLYIYMLASQLASAFEKESEVYPIMLQLVSSMICYVTYELYHSPRPPEALFSSGYGDGNKNTILRFGIQFSTSSTLRTRLLQRRSIDKTITGPRKLLVSPNHVFVSATANGEERLVSTLGNGYYQIHLIKKILAGEYTFPGHECQAESETVEEEVQSTVTIWLIKTEASRVHSDIINLEDKVVSTGEY